ncbi:hypothetical protein SAMN05192529_10788 [Arachidicoccus rhizosphaerae]|uniref:DUF58 domain-containing protein n=1 Tax=Arachidicoccus rhizosphaerae TaxID=551991 RepID=A0A1H3Y5F5_9BACT|nr:hypothetical protein [Arachidicoccus rhizosphaerae]SEA06271.1 hypothetical protein SAMN05192529_10788 [Arachidicoccus rhizosphaerae]
MQQKVSIRKTIKQLGFYAPITGYFCLFLIGSALCFVWLKAQPKLPDTPFQDVFVLLLKITLYVSLTFLSLSLISVLLSWIFFYFNKKRGKVQFHIKTRPFDTPYQPIELKLHPILRPILGYIKLRFVYDNGTFSDKIQLVEDEHANWFNQQLEGFYDWKIENIREYRISSVIVYFEDFLQFFSMAINLASSERFYTPPVNGPLNSISADHRNTEKRVHRIERMRRVKGDLFNYKKFENQDDIRRIVWKIYAKNRELVIRTPEILEPYASHMHLYVSFYSDYIEAHNEITDEPMLNFYKNTVWNIYQSIKKEHTDLRWVSDQPEKAVTFDGHPIKEEEIKHLIALSTWQHNKDLLNFVNTKQAAIVVISSLTGVEQVQQLVAEYGKEITFILVPLSNCIGKQKFSSWISWFFLQAEKDKRARYQSRWSLSPLRKQLILNERALKETINSIPQIN